MKKKKKFSVVKMLTGDMLMHPFVKRQMGLIVLVVCLIVIYEGNRYACQTETVKIQRLRKEIIDLRNESVALRNELMQKSLQSNIERRLGDDNPLKPATAAPVIIDN
ncbi:MAG: hypothetical protein K6B45_09275 [Bacteroidaceae bacterium]|jgi:hypothetical protein|nr:hypothetical protein [Bacteroidaceae bacterium]